jgi:hypothetical protein
VIAGRDSVYHVGATAGVRQATIGTQHLPAHTHSGRTSHGIADPFMRITNAGGDTLPNHIVGYKPGAYTDVTNNWLGQAHYHTFSTNGGDVLSSTPAPIDIQQPTMYMRWIIKA